MSKQYIGDLVEQKEKDAVAPRFISKKVHDLTEGNSCSKKRKKEEDAGTGEYI